MKDIEGTLSKIIHDLLTTYPEVLNHDIKTNELIAFISYVLDSKDIESQEAFHNYLYITNEINELLYYYYPENVRSNSNLFKVGGLLLLLNKDGSFYLSEKFIDLRNKRKSNLIKMFPSISTILTDLQYLTDLSQ